MELEGLMGPATYILIAIALLVIAAAALGIRQVSQSQCGIVERLGRYHRTLPPGLNLIVPFIDRTRHVGSLNLRGIRQSASCSMMAARVRRRLLPVTPALTSHCYVCRFRPVPSDT